MIILVLPLIDPGAVYKIYLLIRVRVHWALYEWVIIR